MKNERKEIKDVKKLLGNPKIIFVCSGPGVGKTTYCQKLVAEFGYTHISMGALFLKEIEKGNKEGERIKKFYMDGGIVPYEIAVNILTKALLANISKHYIIDGFPRAIDQAQHFEQTISEMQQIIYLKASREFITDKLLKRCDTSTRIDDNPEKCKKRIQNFYDQSIPVFEYYQGFGKIRTINAEADSAEIYNQIKNAIMPQTMFVIGPKASGKSQIGQNISERTNMQLINFTEFIHTNGLRGKSDEEVTLSLIQFLSKQITTRVILESFPQNEFQAKFFVRNCKPPSNVFALTCPQDICQERMNAIGQQSKEYVSSAILSQKIKEYHKQARTLVPFLLKNTNCVETNTNQSFEKIMVDVNQHIEPTIIHIRPGANSNELRKEITEQLSKNHGFVNLDVNALIRDENERKTAIGVEIHTMVSSNRIIPAEMIVRMIKRVVYSGDPTINKFILTSFPDIIEQAREFESNCSKISVIIYSTSNEPVVEIKNNNLSLFNIDSLFQKEFRLQTMCNWDYNIFEEKLGKTTEFGVVLGDQHTGKSTVCQQICDNFGNIVINMKSIAEQLKSTMGTDEEPFEGEVPIQDVENAVVEKIRSHKKKVRFVFDGFIHKGENSGEQFIRFVSQFGLPRFIVKLVATEELIRRRYCEKNEIDAVPEEDEEQFAASKEQSDAQKINILDTLSSHLGRIQLLQLETDQSLETTEKVLMKAFQPRVLLVNHEKRLGIDTTCANLAIKYNMIYISSYQIIKQHIEGDTEWGKRLTATQRTKEIQLTTQVRDEFNELQYSPVHFDQTTVISLIKWTIQQYRSDQNLILLEGLCNSNKLSDIEDQLELRLMDELLSIEKNIGPITGSIGLQFQYENETQDQEDIRYEEFHGDAKPAKVNNEDQNSENENNDEPKASAFKIDDHQWTVTNRQPLNLPQLYMKLKAGAIHESKQADQYSASQYEAISKSLDEFCDRMSTNLGPCIYQQVIFQE